MDIAKAVKTGKVKPAYITDKEKSLLLSRDKAKGSISEKFYKGIPVLWDPAIEGERGTTVADVEAEYGGDAADASPADWGEATYAGGEFTDDMGRTIYGPSGHGGRSSHGSYIDPSIEIDAAGGMEFGGKGVPGDGSIIGRSDPDPDDGYDPGSDAGGGRVTTGEGDEGSIGTDWTPEDDADYASRVSEATKSIEAAGPTTSSVKVTGAPTRGVPDVGRYKYREPTVKPGPGVSETERVRAKVDAGTPLSVSIRDHLFGEAGGAASEYKRLSAMDEDREFRENQLAQAQAFASKGMSFSTAQLDAETDMIRDAAKRRLITADEAAKLEHELKMSALRTAEPIELLAAAGKLGDAGYGGTFTPGAIDTSRFMDSDRFGLAKPPGFSGLPAEFEPDDVKESKYTDSTGVTCDIGRAFKNADGVLMCPTSMPSGGGGGEI